MKTREIQCRCGRAIRWRPNSNNVTLCPRCRAAHTKAEFVREEQNDTRDWYVDEMGVVRSR